VPLGCSQRLRKFAETFNFSIPEEGPTTEWTVVHGMTKGWGRFEPSLLHLSGRAVRLEWSPLVPGYFEHLGRARVRDEIFRFPEAVRTEARVFVDEVGFVSAVSQLTPAPCTAWRRGGGSAERGRRGAGRCALRRGARWLGSMCGATGTRCGRRAWRSSGRAPWGTRMLT